MVEGAALEMLCGETHLGFESLTLRQERRVIPSGIALLFYKELGSRKGVKKTFRGNVFSPWEHSVVKWTNKQHTTSIQINYTTVVPNSPPEKVITASAVMAFCFA